MDVPNNNDPANVAAVSGFYGPGAWAAWLCSLTSAWYTLLLRPRATGCSDLIATLLYTNWAAIEFLKQAISGKSNDSYASLGAAATITFWGWCHVILQINVCMLFVPHCKASRQRTLFAIAGVFIPTFASMWVIWDTFIAHGTLLARSLPEDLNHNGLGLWYSSSHDLAATTFGLIFHVILFALVSDMFWITKPGFYATMCTYCFFGMFALTVYSTYRHSPGFVRPCSPQSISEADQAFAVLCGLAALVYQVGPDIWYRTGPDYYYGVLQCYPYEQQRKLRARRHDPYQNQSLLTNFPGATYPSVPSLENVWLPSNGQEEVHDTYDPDVAREVNEYFSQADDP